MRLRRLEIQDFRSFGQAHFDLSRPDGEGTQDIVLLVGPSGTGKTALLDAVAGFFGGLAGELAMPGGSDDDGVDIYQAADLRGEDVRQGADLARIWIDWTDLTLERTSGEAGADQGPYLALGCEARLQAAQDRDGREALHAGAGVFAWADRTIFALKNDATDLKDLNHWRKAVYQFRERAGLIVAFDAQRSLPWARISGPNMDRVTRHRCLGSLASLDWDFTDVSEGLGTRAEQSTQWLVNLEYASFKAGGRQKPFPLWERLIDALNRALSPCRFVEIDEQSRVLFRTPTGTLPVEALSAGFKSIFLIITDLALRLSLAAGNEHDPLAGEAVCLIDEIDAHLDPALQERVLPDLRSIFPGVQFVATTHSQVVASTVQRDQIFVLGEE